MSVFVLGVRLLRVAGGCFLVVEVVVFLVTAFFLLIGFGSSFASTVKSSVSTETSSDFAESIVSCVVSKNSSTLSKVSSTFVVKVSKLACKRLANFFSSFLLTLPNLLY